MCHLNGGLEDAISCLQLTANNCSILPSNKDNRDVFINTEMGVLVNSRDGAHMLLHDGKEQRSTGGTEFISWVKAATITLQDITLVKPDLKTENEVKIINQGVSYTLDLNFSISVPFKDVKERGLQARLWEFEDAIKKVQNSMNASPFMVDWKTILIIASVVVVVVPLFVIFMKIAIKSKCNCSHSEQQNQTNLDIIVPPKTVECRQGRI